MKDLGFKQKKQFIRCTCYQQKGKIMRKQMEKLAREVEGKCGCKILRFTESPVNFNDEKMLDIDIFLNFIVIKLQGDGKLRQKLSRD